MLDINLVLVKVKIGCESDFVKIVFVNFIMLIFGMVSVEVEGDKIFVYVLYEELVGLGVFDEMDCCFCEVFDGKFKV